MTHDHQSKLPPELSAFEAKLAGVQPNFNRLEQEQIWFAAGRDSVTSELAASRSSLRFAKPWWTHLLSTAAGMLLAIAMLPWLVAENDSPRFPLQTADDRATPSEPSIEPTRDAQLVDGASPTIGPGNDGPRDSRMTSLDPDRDVPISEVSSRFESRRQRQLMEALASTLPQSPRPDGAPHGLDSHAAPNELPSLFEQQRRLMSKFDLDEVL